MISKQLLIFGLFVLIVEYYSFTAVRMVIRNTNVSSNWWLYLFYVILSLVTLWSLYAFPHYGKSSWPSNELKYFVNILFFISHLIFLSVIYIVKMLFYQVKGGGKEIFQEVIK